MKRRLNVAAILSGGVASVLVWILLASQDAQWAQVVAVALLTGVVVMAGVASCVLLGD